MTKRARYATLAHQVHWQHPKICQGAIDQTRLSISGAPPEAAPFSFMVMGDTDAGIAPNTDSSAFASAFAEQFIEHIQDSQFLLHTGDVTYPVGSYQNYLEGFLKPYRSLLSALPESASYRHNSIVFNRSLLPVPGNHDYASAGYGLWQKSLRLLCDRLRQFGIDLGYYGGQGSEAYGQTFLDDLRSLSPKQLTAHLATHYTATAGHLPGHEAFNLQYNLSYRPGQFTRLPNRYYRFRYSGIDFFALDSNTWNTDAAAPGFDQQQLAWLESSLIESWQTPGTIGRIIYLHHSPYTTETVRWQQPQTLWVRRHLRAVLSRVAAAEPSSKTGPLVDLVISGHAHCLEHIRTADTGYADAHTDWVVCGGSGAAVRRQREAGADILEKTSLDGRAGRKNRTSVVAKSGLYVGTHGHRHQRQMLHSFLKIDVDPSRAQALRICPYVVSRGVEGWCTRPLEPIGVGRLRPIAKPSPTPYAHQQAS